MGQFDERPRAVGIAWIREEDYPALIAIFGDGHLFDSFEEWEKRALEVEADLERQGIIVERAYMDPDTFAEWCADNGVGTDRDGRIKFGADYVAERYGRNQS